MTPVSVVVANIARDPSVTAAFVSAMCDQLEPEDQLVWVDSAGLECPVPGVTSIVAPPCGNRGHLYALGLQATRHPHVAFTDSFTIPMPRWRSSVARVVGTAAVAGGPVVPTRPRSLRDWAGFFVEYGIHAVPPFTSATGDIAANNVVYDRAVLEGVLTPDEPLWKSVVDARLRAGGHRIVVVEDMAVSSAKAFSWSDLASARVAAGRLYGTQRSEGWSRRHRELAALSCAVLPALAYVRLAARVTRLRCLRRPFATSTPLVLVALVWWSIGEAMGYLEGEGTSTRVF